MEKLYFRYGAMGSSKTANALMVRYNYAEKGQFALLLKPKKENRDGEKIIRSRIGLEAECEFVEDFLQQYKEKTLFNSNGMLNSSPKPAAIIIDETQFLSASDIDTLAHIVDYDNIPVICYGLKTDFKGELFEGSKRLFELADEIEEIPTVCWCGRKARFNARVVNGKIVKNGEQIVLGDNDMYTSLCRKHYMEGSLCSQ